MSPVYNVLAMGNQKCECEKDRASRDGSDRTRDEMEKNMKKTGQSILKSLHEALEHHQGKKTGAREHTFSATEVARIRKCVGLSQQQFSDEFEMA